MTAIANARTYTNLSGHQILQVQFNPANSFESSSYSLVFSQSGHASQTISNVTRSNINLTLDLTTSLNSDLLNVYNNDSIIMHVGIPGQAPFPGKAYLSPGTTGVLNNFYRGTQNQGRLSFCGQGLMANTSLKPSDVGCPNYTPLPAFLLSGNDLNYIPKPNFAQEIPFADFLSIANGIGE